MKQRVLTNLRVTCDPPRHATRWATTLEDQAKALEGWCKEFAEFMRDHRSQDPVDLSVEREYEEQCSYCGSKWEEDDEGPLCCHAAQSEWNLQHADIAAQSVEGV